MRITRYAASLAAAGLMLAACGGSEAGNQAEDAAENTAEEDTSGWSDLIVPTLVGLAVFGAIAGAGVLVHEVAEVIVITNGLRAARTKHPDLNPVATATVPTDEDAHGKTRVY